MQFISATYKQAIATNILSLPPNMDIFPSAISGNLIYCHMIKDTLGGSRSFIFP